MEVKDIITDIGFIGGRDAIIINHVNIINSRTIEIYADVEENGLCDFYDKTIKNVQMKFVFSGVVYYSLYDYEMFESKVKGGSVSSIREKVDSPLYKNGYHHIIIIAYDDIVEIVCKEYTHAVITSNKQQTN